MRIVTIAIASAFAVTPAAGLLAAGKSAAPSYTLASTSYTQDFDGLAASGTANTALPAGFQIVELSDGAAADGRYAASTGSSNGGNIYSFGTSAERALGSLGSGGVAPNYFGGVFTNGLAGTIASLTFGYTGEQWRAGNSGDDRLDFQFSLDATELDNGTWADIDSLDFLPLVLSGDSALNGNLAANQRMLTGTTGAISVAAGQRFAFRWRDLNSDGNDHGLAVDNLTIGATLAPVAVVPEPSAWALLILGFGMTGTMLRRRRQLAFA